MENSPPEDIKHSNNNGANGRCEEIRQSGNSFTVPYCGQQEHSYCEYSAVLQNLRPLRCCAHVALNLPRVVL